MRRRRKIPCSIWLVTTVLGLFVSVLVNAENTTSNDKNNKNENGQTATAINDVIHKDEIDDSLFDPIAADPSCDLEAGEDCFSPPKSTSDEGEKKLQTKIDASCFKGGDDDDAEVNGDGTCIIDANENDTDDDIDPHWGSDKKVKKMRNHLREQAQDRLADSRPPIFLLPGLASTRLVAWKYKKCSGAFSSDIRVRDNVWLNINLVIQMGTINVDCLKECLKLGMNQSDTDDWDLGCKLRPDEGLDAIASLAPGGIGSSLLVGGTNTVYAWLIQWLADNMGYDVTNIIGLPYDWRLTIDKMEKRDGFLSILRRRIEAAVATNGKPGIVVAHSMGNVVLRYFLEWLRVEMRQEAYNDYIGRARRRAQNMKKKHNAAEVNALATPWSALPGWLTSVVSGVDEWYEWLTSEEIDISLLDGEDAARHAQLVQLSEEEGDAKWLEWIETHIWTYVGLSAPMLGAVNPLRAVISGENMGLPITDEVAREMEVTFGSTHTLNPIPAATGFCDDWSVDDWGEEPSSAKKKKSQMRHNLACLDDIMNDIELSSVNRDSWANFPALKALLRDRIDWDTHKPMMDIEISHCVEKSKNPCEIKSIIKFGPRDVANGKIFETFHEYWNETDAPLLAKKEQLVNAYWNSKVSNILDNPWDRPLIKHVIMAYGVDFPTEAGYIYNKEYKIEGPGKNPIVTNEPSGLPDLKTVIWEEQNGKVTMQEVESSRGVLAEKLIKKKVKREPLDVKEARLPHSGDGSVPYLSLSWAHTWLLHAARAKRFSEADRATTDQQNVLDHIEISYRPHGATEWKEGPPGKPLGMEEPKRKDDADTGTTHPHGTRYKPEMIRYHNVGISRTTGIEYTTSVIEAVGVEHKETTRNYDILAAVFTDVLKYMHNDLGLMDE